MSSTEKYIAFVSALEEELRHGKWGLVLSSREKNELLSACYAAPETDTPNEVGIITLQAALTRAEGDNQ